MSLKVSRTLIFLAAAVVGVLHGFLKEPPEPAQVESVRHYLGEAQRWQGRYPPDVELTLLDGSSFVMADEVGRSVIVLNFWATWCAPCREEMPELQRFVDAHDGDALRFVAVDADESEEAVRTFLEHNDLHLPVAIDRGDAVGDRFGVVSYPTTVVVGADGRIVLYEVGAIHNADVSLAGLVDREQETIRAGGGIGREDYLAALAEQPPLPGMEEPEPRLDGRALEIAEAMTCPCGCSDKVAVCTCDTAERITTALLDMDLTGRDDVEVIEELNGRFCVGGTG